MNIGIVYHLNVRRGTACRALIPHPFPYPTEPRNKAYRIDVTEYVAIKNRPIGISADKAASYHKHPARKTSSPSLNTGTSLQIGLQNRLIDSASHAHKRGERKGAE
jgi:hypothetical protein